ncbi:MAG: trypsin-like serine peptidase [Bdellovibrionota bacterium]
MIANLPLIFLAFSLSAQAAIFGADNRSSVTPGSAYYETGKAVAVAVLSSLIEPSTAVPGTLQLTTDPLTDLVCSDEHLAKQPSLSYSCSGFLVAPDLMVTAGHCMVNTGESKDEPGMYCDAYGWLFDYQNDAKGDTKLDGIPAANYYKCRRIVYAIREEAPPYRDYALVQLERPVTGRKPFPISTAPLALGDRLAMIGFPFGTPMTVSPGGRVTLNNPARPTFLTSLSAFEGNSGSVVFNDKREAVGILVGGTPSANLVDDKAKSCQRYNRCDENGRNCTENDKDTSVFPGYQGIGSEVQRIAPIAELLKQLQ